MNVELLRKVKKHILAEPKRWSFSWARASSVSPCGTQACIGGWTVILGENINPSSYEARHGYLQRSEIARQLLNITRKEADRLFFSGQKNFLKVRALCTLQKPAPKTPPLASIKTKGVD